MIIYKQNWITRGSQIDEIPDVGEGHGGDNAGNEEIPELEFKYSAIHKTGANQEITAACIEATYQNAISDCDSGGTKKCAQWGRWWNQNGPFPIKNRQQEKVEKKAFDNISENQQNAVAIIAATYQNVISD